MMGRRLLGANLCRLCIAVFLGTLFFFIYADVAHMESAFSITLPQDGTSMVNNNVQISGTGPSATILTVAVTDTDMTSVTIKHQPNGQVEGTVTTGQDGTWIYVPQQILVPGQFSVQASYTNAQNQIIRSNIVRFVIVDSNGSSAWISTTLLEEVAVIGGLILILVASIIIVWRVNKRRKNKLAVINQPSQPVQVVTPVSAPMPGIVTASVQNAKNQDEEVLHLEHELFIERELLETTEKLRQTDAKVVELDEELEEVEERQEEAQPISKKTGKKNKLLKM